ncbi:MAG TPA: hypothetical protein VHJ20_00875 [Polyangia bacterium]|nr:hypothetical protein [Polyangia bacterium]
MRRISAASVAVLISACAGIKMPAGQQDAGGLGGNAGSGNIFATGGATGDPFGNPDAAAGGSSSGGGHDGGTTYSLAGSIASDTPDPVTVSGKPTQVHLGVKLNDGTTPDPSRIAWTVDNVAIGSVGADGVFTPNGTVGGVATVTAQVGNGVATKTITVDVDITDDPGTLNPQDMTKLETGGTGGDAQFKWLYPYDGTVFPRGLTAPTLQFGGTGTRATYTTITAPHFKYQQIANINDPLRVVIPPAIWKGVGLTVGPKDKITATVTKLAGDTATGPLTRSWFVAPATINGIFYYNTYTGSMLADGGGGIMRVPAGQDAQLVVKGCTVCHSISANGGVLAAGSQNVPNADGDWNPKTSQTYDLGAGAAGGAAGAATIRTQTNEGRTFSFMGLVPDGSKGLVSGLPPKRNAPFLPHGIASTPGTPSTLVDTKTGAVIAAPSLTSLVQYATTPAFSPDGAHVAFVNGDRLGATCIDTKTCDMTCLMSCSRVLSIMDFDGTASPPVFSNLRDVVTNAGAGHAVAWPSFLPDGKAVIYHEGDSLDSDVFQGDTSPLGPQYAELRLVETADKTVKTLNAVNGRDATGTLVLPYGEIAEGRMNYEPSVLPIAVGGYYWVLFTSRRVYGNMISPTSNDPPGSDPFGSEANPSTRKKVWIAAIDIDHASKADPSHPAFFLPGQELRTANMRAFAALAPCKQDNSSCETGADCCGGYCRETSRAADGTPMLSCIAPPAHTCSDLLEPCTTSTDCCNPKNQCINGKCSYIIP